MIIIADAYSDYYPFGMLMPNRHGQSDDYRYGFQGQEMDDEVKGKGVSANYKYRMNDTRIGRFFAVDPITDKYPELTPYQFSSNRPIDAVEWEGLEASIAVAVLVKGVELAIVGITSWFIAKELSKIDIDTKVDTDVDTDTDEEEKELKIYRSMTRDHEFSYNPAKGHSARTLGVRPKPKGDTWIKNSDITLDADGNVLPKTGGMSVNILTTIGMKDFRKPKEFGGTGKDPMWSMNEKDVSDGSNGMLKLVLSPTKDNPNHAVIEPTVKMSYDDFEGHLHGLQSYWTEEKNDAGN